MRQGIRKQNSYMMQKHKNFIQEIPGATDK